MDRKTNLIEDLSCALKNYKASDFKHGVHEVIYCIGQVLLNTQLSDQILLKLDEPSEEKLLSTKQFCENLVVDGKAILNSHDLVHYLQKDHDYFEGCFSQRKPKARIYVRQEKLLNKLKDYESTTSNLKENISKYLRMRELKPCHQNPQQITQQQSLFTALDKPTLI